MCGICEGASVDSINPIHHSKAELPSLESAHIAVIGLGYVGLPLSLALGRLYPCVGFDIDSARIDELRRTHDRSAQVSSDEIESARLLTFSYELSAIAEANIYIICVPTPIDKHKVPNLAPLLSASEIVGRVLQRGNVVIYESTTYPTCTENECKDKLESTSSLRFNEDFYLGYSPERINPSDKEHSLTQICKVTSGSNEAVAELVDSLYASIITAGTHRASSMRVAEMSKLIENAQRDLNIAFVNEVAMICNYLDIDVHEVLSAARSKWNFLPFSPGLVGGHCISVDPYYLTHKMNAIGYFPQVISSGRLINDAMPHFAMPHFVAQKIIKLMVRSQILILGSKILILGIAFKPDCPDIRNSKVPLVKDELESYGAQVSVYDSVVSAEEVQRVLTTLVSP